MWTQSDLINISKKPLGMREATVLKLANAKRPIEVEEFVDALSRMFGRIGMHAVCGLCFRGKLRYLATDGNWRANVNHSVGCCSSCPLLTATRCANKPMLCASWMCTTVATLFPATEMFTGRLLYALRWAGVAAWAYTQGIKEESTQKLTTAQRRLLRVLRHAVDAWSEPT